MRRSSLRAGARLSLAAAIAVIAASVLALPAYAADDAPDPADTPSGGVGIGLSAPVIASTPSPSPSTPSTGGAGGAGTGTADGPTLPGRGSTGSTTPATAVATDTATPEPAATDMMIAGGLYLSDISGASRPTINPFEGKADLWVTLRNLSDETIDATADFSIATATGTRIDGSRVSVTALKPGEARVVGATLAGTGQWPFVVGRVTIDPPDQIAGQQTADVSRATVVYVFPWLGVIGLVLAALAVVLIKVTTAVAAPAASAGTAAAA